MKDNKKGKKPEKITAICEELTEVAENAAQTLNERFHQFRGLIEMVWEKAKEQES